MATYQRRRSYYTRSSPSAHRGTAIFIPTDLARNLTESPGSASGDAVDWTGLGMSSAAGTENQRQMQLYPREDTRRGKQSLHTDSGTGILVQSLLLPMGPSLCILPMCMATPMLATLGHDGGAE